MNDGRDLVRRLVAAGAEQRGLLVERLGEEEARRLDADWPAWRHEGQSEPAGDDWRVWVMLAGRGFGKTRAGAEWVSQFARANPGASIALVAATADEARRVMIEGPSGLRAVARPNELRAMAWEPSLGRLTFASGARAFVYSGAHPDGLRGPQHHIAWCDELAKWAKAGESWTNLQLGLRCGERPRALVTTTPRAMPALSAILGEEGVVRSGGGTAENPHLPPAFVGAMERQHRGTRLGRQELDGELIEDVEGALWTAELIERSRCLPEARELGRRVVVGVDPPASAGGTCGIVACGLARDGIGYVLADRSVGGRSPEGWAREVAAAAEVHGGKRHRRGE